MLMLQAEKQREYVRVCMLIHSSLAAGMEVMGGVDGAHHTDCSTED